MRPSQRWWPRCFAVFALLASLLVTIAGPVTAAPAADIEGNTYTSPQFGYSLTWDDSWFVIGEESDQFDSLELTNGVTYVNMVGGEDFAGIPALGLAAIFGSLRSDPSIESATELPDTSVEEEDRAAAAYEVVINGENGEQTTVIVYADVRTLVAGESVVLFQSYVPANLFADEWPLIEDLLDGLEIPNQGQQSDDPTPDDPDNTDDPTPDDPNTNGDQEAGEPGPVFASGQWRVALRSAVLNDELDDVGLQGEDGDEWLVLVADVTNWSDEDGEFDATEFSIQIESEDTPFEVDEDSTSAVSSELNLALEDSAQVAIDAGATERVALVYALPERSRGITLLREDDALPVDDALSNTLDPDDLPDPVAPPELENGELESSSDGRTVSVVLDGEDDAEDFGLIGVELPAEGDCGAEALLNDFAGAEVLVETDASVDEGTGDDRYVWLVNDDGTRTLLNQQVIADGLATADSLPAEARFGAWLAESEQRAEDDELGLWGECEPGASTGGTDEDTTPEPTDEPTETADDEPTEEPTAEPTDEPTEELGGEPTRPAPRANPGSSDDSPDPTPTPDE
jgi:hypothetical protein